MVLLDMERKGLYRVRLGGGIIIMSQITKRALEQSLKNLLLKKPLTKITVGDKSEVIELYSQKLATDCTYLEAIDAVQNYDGETVERLFYGNRALAEINVRLISDDGKNYYFVGLIEEGGKTSAYLIDAATKTVIATRTVGK